MRRSVGGAMEGVFGAASPALVCDGSAKGVWCLMSSPLHGAHRLARRTPARLSVTQEPCELGKARPLLNSTSNHSRRRRQSIPHQTTTSPAAHHAAHTRPPCPPSSPAPPSAPRRACVPRLPCAGGPALPPRVRDKPARTPSRPERSATPNYMYAPRQRSGAYAMY